VLKAEDTTDWLPLGKGLEGLRVWVPVAKADGLHQLGIVQTVDGAVVNVKKMADGQTVASKREVLRPGNMRAGLKVLAFCVDPQNLVPARFEEVIANATGHPVARVMCLTAEGKDDKSRNELIGALRSKPEWLPARKP
jgi:hypothetical protein